MCTEAIRSIVVCSNRERAIISKPTRTALEKSQSTNTDIVRRERRNICEIAISCSVLFCCRLRLFELKRRKINVDLIQGKLPDQI
ncbi:hypothetical protein Trydic_g14118 [Trypoxylus dichotomus]